MVCGPTVEEGQPASKAPAWVLGIERLIEALGNSIAWLGLGMVVVTTVVVVLRYGFGIGSIAMQEAVAYMHATLFTLGASYCLKHDAHVRVDVLYRGWSARAKAVVDLAGTVLLLMPFCGFLVWVSLDYVRRSFELLEGSAEAGGLPGVFILKALIPAMGVLVMLAGLAKIGRAVSVLREPA